MKDLGIARRYLGMEIEYRKDGSIKIHQNRYIQQLLEHHGMMDCNPVTTPLDMSTKLSSITSEEAPADTREYASIVGGLMFAACVTRPDIMCVVGQLSQFRRPSICPPPNLFSAISKERPISALCTVLLLCAYKVTRMRIRLAI